MFDLRAQTRLPATAGSGVGIYPSITSGRGRAGVMAFGSFSDPDCPGFRFFHRAGLFSPRKGHG